MEVSFQLLGKGFSINQAYYAQRKVKTEACRLWEYSVLTQLQEIKDLVDLADTHKERGGTFEVHFALNYPHHVFYNKQGLISSKTYDVSNFEKLLLDVIFGQVLGINDKLVTKLISEKRVGARHSIDVKIRLIV